MDRQELKAIQTRALAARQALVAAAAATARLGDAIQTTEDNSNLIELILTERRAQADLQTVLTQTREQVVEAKRDADQYKNLWANRGTQIVELESEITRKNDEIENLRKKALDLQLMLRRRGAPDDIFAAAENLLQR